MPDTHFGIGHGAQSAKVYIVIDDPHIGQEHRLSNFSLVKKPDPEDKWIPEPKGVVQSKIKKGKVEFTPPKQSKKSRKPEVTLEKIRYVNTEAYKSPGEEMGIGIGINRDGDVRIDKKLKITEERDYTISRAAPASSTLIDNVARQTEAALLGESDTPSAPNVDVSFTSDKLKSITQQLKDMARVGTPVLTAMDAAMKNQSFNVQRSWVDEVRSNALRDSDWVSTTGRWVSRGHSRSLQQVVLTEQPFVGSFTGDIMGQAINRLNRHQEQYFLQYMHTMTFASDFDESRIAVSYSDFRHKLEQILESYPHEEDAQRKLASKKLAPYTAQLKGELFFDREDLVSAWFSKASKSLVDAQKRLNLNSMRAFMLGYRETTETPYVWRTLTPSHVRLAIIETVRAITQNKPLLVRYTLKQVAKYMSAAAVEKIIKKFSIAIHDQNFIMQAFFSCSVFDTAYLDVSGARSVFGYRHAMSTILSFDRIGEAWLQLNPVALSAKVEQVQAENNKNHKNHATTRIHEDLGDATFIKIDDTFVWAWLNRSKDESEAKAMSHCGGYGSRINERVLSLRSRVKGNKWKSHLTFIARYEDHEKAADINSEFVITEAKGYANSKPSEKYHDQIVALLKDKRLLEIVGGGYNAYNNFGLQDLNEARMDDVSYHRLSNGMPVLRQRSIMSPVASGEIVGGTITGSQIAAGSIRSTLVPGVRITAVDHAIRPSLQEPVYVVNTRRFMS